MYFQMLRLAKASASSVLTATRGVIFLGTPHYESVAAPWQLIIQRIIQSVTIPDVATPPNLTEEEKEIEESSQLFEYVTPPQSRQIQIFTFIETDSVSCYCY
jgi:hypothetical protein